jgi:protein-disulfide isomerase
MSPQLSKQEILRQKRLQQRKRNTTTALLVGFAGLLLILAMFLLPNILNNLSHGLGSPGFPLGDPDAPVTVYEFSSYSCSHCYTFNEGPAKDFIAKYVDTGLVYFNYVNLPANNEGSLLAAKASYCAAAQEKFYDYKDQLFAYASVENGFSESNMINFATFAGLDVAAFSACMDSDKYTTAYDQDIRFATNSSVTGTPSFLVNGTDLVSVSQLDETVEKYLNN